MYKPATGALWQLFVGESFASDATSRGSCWSKTKGLVFVVAGDAGGFGKRRKGEADGSSSGGLVQEEKS
jgi:hypothetical protein